MGQIFLSVCLLASLLLFAPIVRGVALAQKPPPGQGAPGGAAGGAAGSPAQGGASGGAAAGAAGNPAKGGVSGGAAAGAAGSKSSGTPAAPANDPTQRTPTFGGSGGTGFELRCGQGYVLTGLRGRQGMVVDRVGVLCRPVRSDGTLGSETTVGGEVGGGGGNAASVSCSSGDVVTGLSLRFGTYVDSMSLVCRNWHAGTRSTGARAVGERKLGGGGGSGSQSVTCGSDRQPGAGIRGRAASVLDSVGLVCNEP